MTRTTTKYPLRIISPDIFFTEEQRGNIHIIGSSRQGKSRLIEFLMRGDIDRDLSCCLLDPTAGGETAYRMLAYCAEKGKKNVLFVDPAHADPPYKKVLGLNPFKYDRDGRGWPKLRRISVATLMNAVRSLYSVKDPAEQSRVERYLPAVFTALYDAKSPLVDARYFGNRLYKDRRDDLLLMTDEAVRTDLQEAFIPGPTFTNFQSTVNRLVRFVRGTLGLMFSADRGVNWMKVIRERWAVIVNLDGLDFFDARLLGTYVIAELETAKQRLNQAMDENRDPKDRGTYPPFYLYADEAFMFASQSLKNMLDLKQKMNFKLTLAHHYKAQFDDPAVYDSILQNCDITAMFYTRSHADRRIISTEFYGGNIDFEDAAFATKQLQKQNAVIKVSKDNPAFTKIPDVEPPDVTREQLRNYLLELYRNNWYYDSDKLDQPAYEPPRTQKKDSQPARPRTKADSSSDSKPRVPDKGNQANKWKAVSRNLPVGSKHADEDGGAEGA